MNKSGNGMSDVSNIGRLWALFCFFFIFSLWRVTRPTIMGFSMHPALLILPIILVYALATKQLYLKNIGKYLFFSITFLNICLVSAILNDAFDYYYIVKWVVSIFIMLLAGCTIRRKEDIVFVLKALVLSIGFMCLYGIMTWKGAGHAVNPFHFSSRNALSNWTAGIFVISLIFCLFYPSSLKQRILFGSILVIMIISQIYTLNRSSWGIIFLSIILPSVFFKSKKPLFYLICLFLCFLLVGSKWFGFKAIQRRYDTIITVQNLTSDNSFQDRIDQGKKTFDIIVKNPLFGVGVGKFREYDPDIHIAYADEESHNAYLMVLAETGILGFLALGIMVFYVGRSLWRTGYQVEDIRDRSISYMCFMAFLMVLLRGFTSHEIQFIPVTGIISGLALSYIAIMSSSSALQGAETEK